MPDSIDRVFSAHIAHLIMGRVNLIQFYELKNKSTVRVTKNSHKLTDLKPQSFTKNSSVFVHPLRQERGGSWNRLF